MCRVRRVLEDLQITVDKTYERKLQKVSHAHRLWQVATDAGVVPKRIRSWKEIYDLSRLSIERSHSQYHTGLAAVIRSSHHQR